MIPVPISKYVPFLHTDSSSKVKDTECDTVRSCNQSLAFGLLIYVQTKSIIP